ncbi:MAG: hypothetical protein QHJ73_04330 [Armatimonadota bacterium]|nr:hypothetical protein [Armatimonadota bacterium]
MTPTGTAEECFTGTYVYTVDPKGRVIMPRRFRERLGTPFILTKGVGGCLLALSRERWDPLVERFGNDSIIFQRFYLAGAVECSPSQRSGRFLIPHPLREFADITPTQEAAVAGVGPAVEIWNKQAWERASKQSRAKADSQLHFELDLEVPPSEPFEMRVRSLLGIPVVQARGTLDARAGRALAARMQEVTPEAVRAVVVDLRQTSRLRAAPAGLRWAVSQQKERGVAVCVLSSDAGAVRFLAGHADVFPSLEEALWWLEEHREALGQDAPPQGGAGVGTIPFEPIPAEDPAPVTLASDE